MSVAGYMDNNCKGSYLRIDCFCVMSSYDVFLYYCQCIVFIVSLCCFKSTERMKLCSHVLVTCGVTLHSYLYVHFKFSIYQVCFSVSAFIIPASIIIFHFAQFLKS